MKYRTNHKELAPESEKTKRARAKLRRKIESIEKQITRQALEKKTIEIHQWIARNASNRVVLFKAFSLFDENAYSAKVSRKVQNIAARIRASFQ